ncbi:MAG TPA: flagellar FlbD family protein [Limnochordia bacterium]
MIRLRRLDGKEFVLNALLVETVEAVPDTVVVLTTGKKFVVRDALDDVVAAIAAYHRSVAAGWAARMAQD